MEDYFELQGYGIKLKLLTHDKIEQLRQWRNDPKIQQYMFYREYITPEMQEKWYANLDKKSNYYFFIEFNGKEIGTIDIKNIDYVAKIGEGGIFIYEDKYLCTDLSYRAHQLLFEFAFQKLGLKAINAHVLKSNTRAVRLTKYLGLKVTCEQDNNDMMIFTMTVNDFNTDEKRTRFCARYR